MISPSKSKYAECTLPSKVPLQLNIGITPDACRARLITCTEGFYGQLLGFYEELCNVEHCLRASRDVALLEQEQYHDFQLGELREPLTVQLHVAIIVPPEDPMNPTWQVAIKHIESNIGVCLFSWEVRHANCDISQIISHWRGKAEP